MVPLTPEESRSELRTAFPFGRLRREGTEGLEMVEIQLEKYGRPAFRLVFGVAPPSGISTALGHVAQQDIWAPYLDEYYVLYRRPLLRKWFSVWHWPGRSVNESDYDELVKSVVELIPEVEQALKNGKRGPHVRQVR